MNPYTFHLAKEADREEIIRFMNTHWETKHPLINLPDFFAYYYKGEKDTLRFVLAKKPDGAIAALAGYIPSSFSGPADIWVSLWVADPSARGSGLELMAALPEVTGCRTLSCNNIRPETRPFYEFLGYTTARMEHYYRLADKESYSLAKPQTKEILPVGGEGQLALLETPEELANCGFQPPEEANPYKDLAYLTKRYFHFPRQSYRLYKAFIPGQKPQALLAVRVVPSLDTCVLRIVDYIGDKSFLPQLGSAIQKLLEEANAEYADFYTGGLSACSLTAAGFSLRAEGDGTIIPNYLTPPLFENTEYYYFTSRPDHFTIFKADGDQDRPNIQL